MTQSSIFRHSFVILPKRCVGLHQQQGYHQHKLLQDVFPYFLLILNSDFTIQNFQISASKRSQRFSSQVILLLTCFWVSGCLPQRRNLGLMRYNTGKVSTRDLVLRCAQCLLLPGTPQLLDAFGIDPTFTNLFGV